MAHIHSHSTRFLLCYSDLSPSAWNKNRGRNVLAHRLLARGGDVADRQQPEVGEQLGNTCFVVAIKACSPWSWWVSAAALRGSLSWIYALIKRSLRDKNRQSYASCTIQGTGFASIGAAAIAVCQFGANTTGCNGAGEFG